MGFYYGRVSSTRGGVLLGWGSIRGGVLLGVGFHYLTARAWRSILALSVTGRLLDFNFTASSSKFLKKKKYNS